MRTMENKDLSPGVTTDQPASETVKSQPGKQFYTQQPNNLPQVQYYQ